LHRALQDKDAATVRIVAHSLKSSSANLGALGLSALFKDLEEKARNNSLVGAFELIALVESEFKKTIEPLCAQMVKT
jgi:HPt (histidine-containing phosphotransfer) domain-containing protein